MEIPKCKYCNKLCKKRWPGYTKTCCSKECICKDSSSRKHSTESIEKIRQARIKFLKKRTGKTAWERRSKGEMSYLEKWFFTEIIEKYELYKKFDIIYDYSFYPYFIDFAFTNIKLAVELDGKCHFIHGNTRIKRDIKKDKYLTDNNWIVYRIKYNEINNKTIIDFLDFIENIKIKEIKVYGNQLYKYTEIKKQKNKKTWDEHLAILKEKSNNLNLPRVEKILASNINFNKFGWVTKAAKLINIHPGKIHILMKKYANDFYVKNCLIRKK